MSTNRYAAIGTRKLSSEQIRLCNSIGRYLGKLNWVLHTGACTGADQEYANGALEAGGRVRLHLPWASYERTYVETVQARYPGQVRITVLSDDHQEAFDSVRNFHPAWDYLVRADKRAVIMLHARNWNILWLPSRVNLVIALPRVGGGGTMQGVRIALANQIPVLRLDRVAAASAKSELDDIIASCML